jgi:hypothetical protein
MLSTPSSTPTARSCPDIESPRYSIPHRTGAVDPGYARYNQGVGVLSARASQPDDVLKSSRCEGRD